MLLLASRLPAGDSSPGFPSGVFSLLFLFFFVCFFFFLFSCHCECTSASAGGAACLLGAILSLSHHLDVQGVRPGTQSRLQPRHAALYPVAYGEREDAATQVRPRHPTPHLMGCAPPYCSFAGFAWVLGDCFSLRLLISVIITMNTWLLVINSECCPKLPKILLKVCRAALHLGKHEQKLLAYSVLLTSLQHCVHWRRGSKG